MLKNICIAALMLGLAYMLVDIPLALRAACAVHPHSIEGLVTIFTAPFCHNSQQHFTVNAAGFVVFALLIIISEPSQSTFLRVTVATIAGAGLLIWFLSDDSVVGMSGMLYGYLGFLLARVLSKRDLVSVVIAVGAGVYYGYVLTSIMHITAGVSWEAHLGGLIGGVVAALCLPVREARAVSAPASA